MRIMSERWHDLHDWKKQLKDRRDRGKSQPNDGMMTETWGSSTDAALLPLPRTWKKKKSYVLSDLGKSPVDFETSLFHIPILC